MRARGAGRALAILLLPLVCGALCGFVHAACAQGADLAAPVKMRSGQDAERLSTHPCRR